MKLSKYQQRLLLANFGVWVIYISINFSAFLFDAARAEREIVASRYLIAYMISFGPWMFATPVFYYFLNRAQKARKNLFFASVSFVFFWFPCVFFLEAYSLTVMQPEKEGTLIEIGMKMPAWYWVYYTMLYSAAIGVCISIIYYRKFTNNRKEALEAKEANIKLELQLSQLKMKSLQSQLEPHFLFNSLNAISSLVRISERQQALNAIKQLSDLLRYAVDASSHQFVAFDNELNFVKDYIALQTLRFEDKLSVKLSDQRKGHQQECPPFLLQIFVENAIRHGLEKSGEAMTLEIGISEQNNSLKLLVKNSHQKCEPNTDTLGIGLSNLKQRLEILYGESVSFKVSNTEGHYSVELFIPSNAAE